MWDANKLGDFFIFDDVVAIQNILLTRTLKEDIKYWFYDDKGEYSVRNGYRLAYELDSMNLAGASSRYDFWNKLIWNLKISNKVKHFL